MLFVMLLAGFSGGFVGSTVADIVLPERRLPGLGVLIDIGLWAGTLGAFISAGLSYGAKAYRRHFSPDWRSVGLSAFIGLVGGFAGGAGAQFLYNYLQSDSFWINEIFMRPIAWAILGGIVGASLAKAIPNLLPLKALLGGGIGGVVGSWAFIAIAASLGEDLGRAIGVGALGAGIGIALVVVDRLAREGYLEITWAPNEVTTVSLGPRPVMIGGSDRDDIYISGLAAATGGVVLKNGLVQFIDGTTEKTTDLRDGSRIKVGRVEIVVRVVNA
jgi:Ca-activated chloride channel homolog